VNRQDLADALEQYRSGLDTAVSLLRQLKNVAGRQREGTASRNFERLAAEADARDELTHALVAIEPSLRQVKAILAKEPTAVSRLPGYAEVAALKQTASDLVAEILKTDEESMHALADAELARRAAVASLECGEATLAAYRRVLNPPLAGASLLNLRG
jgi:hypothetical protein